MAILIGSGNKNESAVALCKRILASVSNNLNQLSQVSVPQLQKFNGIGEAKAITIVASLELGRRQQLQDVPLMNTISSSSDAFKLMRPLLGNLLHEEFWVLYLNNSNKVTNKIMISRGGQTGTIVDVRLIFKEALENNAVALILVHNHPSGKLEPSEADKQITNQIRTAGITLSLKIMDHLIVTEKDYYSFADNAEL